MKNAVLVASLLIPIVSLFGQQNNEKPLKPEQVVKENKATAVEEQKVAQETSEMEKVLRDENAQIKPQQNEPSKITTRSVAEESGLSKSVMFSGQWAVQYDFTNKEMVITGGTIKNAATAPSDKLRLMVYVSDKPFDLVNPEVVGTPLTSVDLEGLGASAQKENQSYVAPIVLESDLPSGTYYTYILLGEYNASIQNYEVKDVKVFKESISLP